MYRGVANPAIVFEGQRVDLPNPKKDGRKEQYEPAWKTYENIDGEILTGTNHKWRFIAEYEFGKVEQNILDTLIAIYNRSLVVKLIPHSDVPQIAYWVIIEEIDPAALEGRINIDTVKIKVRGRNLVCKIPTQDNMYGIIQFNRVIKYSEV